TILPRSSTASLPELSPGALTSSAHCLMVCDSERHRSTGTGAVLFTGGVVVSLAHASASRADKHSAPPTTAPAPIPEPDIGSASLANRDAQKVSADTQSGAVTEPTGGSAGRSPY